MANAATRESRRVALRAACEFALAGAVAGGAWGAFFAIIYNRRAGGTWLEDFATATPAVLALAGGVIAGRDRLGCVGSLFGFPPAWLAAGVIEVAMRRLIIVAPKGVTLASFGEMLFVSLLLPGLPIAAIVLVGAILRRRLAR